MYFKQKTDIKPELLFFQEGFAVAMGGRGGEHFTTNLNIGQSLIRSNLVNYSEIFSNSDFNNSDASISYNTSAFYNGYIITQFGFLKYMEIYKKFSGTMESVSRFNSSEIDVFNGEDFNKYIELIPEMINLDINGKGFNNDISDDIAEISSNDMYYKFKVKNSILLSEREPIKNYISKKFEEIFPGREYNGEKYYINVNSDGVSIYNLYTNELLGMYAKSFSENGEQVTFNNGYFEFYAMKYIFDEPLRNFSISN
jgi:hypothetical protein